MTGVWIALTGALLLAYTGWCWAGRSARARRWARRVTWNQMILGLFPGLGMVLLASGIAAALPDPLVGLAAPLILVAFALFAMGLVYIVFRPRWWGPRWYRRMPASQRRSDVDDPITAAYASVAHPSGARSQQAAARAVADRFGTGARPVARFGGGYVRDPDSPKRDHALARKGTVAGELAVFAKGVAFAATPTEDSLRAEPTVLVLPKDQIRDVRVVPARAGADGRRRAGFFYRSVFPRLVVRTGDDSYVFEVAFGKAGRAAATIRTTIE